jgi:hypothetical protein
VDPEPSDPQNQKKETTPDTASLGKIGRQKTCSHPEEEIHRFSDDIVICFLCYGLLEEATTETRNCHDAFIAA